MNPPVAWDALNLALVIAGLAAVTVLTRAFFLLPTRPLPMPPWLQRALRYAPLGALVAIVVPEVLLAQGQLSLGRWLQGSGTVPIDARLLAALAGAAWYVRRRGILGTIVCGMAVYLPLHLGLGW